MKTTRFIIRRFWLLVLFPFMSFAQSSNQYMLDEADGYFRSGRYWDAFFLYRHCAKLPEFQSQDNVIQQISNSSHAMFLTKRFKDYRAFKQYDLAKVNLTELVQLNPSDPNRDEIPRITLDQAADMQRMAWRQKTPAATADMLQKAIMYYHQAIREGLADVSIENRIRQCEKSLDETGTLATSQGSSTYGIDSKPKTNLKKPVDIEIKPN